MVTPMWEHEIRAEAAYRSERVREAMAPRPPRRTAGHRWTWLRGRSTRPGAPARVRPASPALPAPAGTPDVATESLGLRPA